MYDVINGQRLVNNEDLFMFRVITVNPLQLRSPCFSFDEHVLIPKTSYAKSKSPFVNLTGPTKMADSLKMSTCKTKEKHHFLFAFTVFSFPI